MGEALEPPVEIIVPSKTILLRLGERAMNTVDIANHRYDGIMDFVLESHSFGNMRKAIRNFLEG